MLLIHFVQRNPNGIPWSGNKCGHGEPEGAGVMEAFGVRPLRVALFWGHLHPASPRVLHLTHLSSTPHPACCGCRSHPVCGHGVELGIPEFRCLSSWLITSAWASYLASLLVSVSLNAKQCLPQTVIMEFKLDKGCRYLAHPCAQSEDPTNTPSFFVCDYVPPTH